MSFFSHCKQIPATTHTRNHNHNPPSADRTRPKPQTVIPPESSSSPPVRRTIGEVPCATQSSLRASIPQALSDHGASHRFNSEHGRSRPSPSPDRFDPLNGQVMCLSGERQGDLPVDARRHKSDASQQPHSTSHPTSLTPAEREPSQIAQAPTNSHPPASPKCRLPQDCSGAQPSHTKRSRSGTSTSSTQSEPIDLCEDEDDRMELVMQSSYDTLMRDVHESAKNRFSIADKDSDAAHLKATSRFLNRDFGPYENIAQVIKTGLAIHRLGPLSPADRKKAIKNHSRNSSTALVKHRLDCFEQMLEYWPDLKPIMAIAKDRSDDIGNLADFMDRHARAGCASDLNEIRKDLHRYLPTVTLVNKRVIPALTEKQLETDRNVGFNSDCIGRLIVNINERDAFDTDPEGYRNLALAKLSTKPGAKKSTTRKGKGPEVHGPRNSRRTLPAFLFPSYLDYDPEAKDRGLGQSALVVKIFRHIFKGCGAALREPGAGSRGRACLYDMAQLFKVRVAHIAYLATVLRFMLETGGEWKDEDPDGAGQAFFEYILKFLTAEEDRLLADEEDSMSEGGPESDTDEVDEDNDFGVIDLNANLVAWWNYWVFGSTHGDRHQVHAAAHDTDDDEDLREDILAARQARHEARRAKRRARKVEQQDGSEGPVGSSAEV